MKKCIIKVLAIDPGLTNTGWVLIEYDAISGKSVVTNIGEFHPGPTAEKASFRDEVDKFSKRTISLKLLREELSGIMFATQPDYVAIEDIFFNPQRPMAHAALAMWHCVARMSCLDTLNKPVEIIPTKIAKQVTTGSGGNGKLSVQQAIMSNPDIKFKNKELEMTLNEHQADAVAVGYAFVVKNKERISVDFGLIKR